MKTLKKGTMGICTMLLLAGLLTGCPDITQPEPTVKTTELTAKIAEAESAITGIRIAADETTVPSNFQWVTQEVMDAFKGAIAGAKSALSATTQEEVDAATDALSNAIATFKAAQSAGSRPPLDVTALNTAITNAKAAREGVMVDTSSANVPQGTYWVTQQVMNTLVSAIATAETALITVTTSQAVTDATTALTIVITAFDNAKEMGTKPPPQGTVTITGFGAAYNGGSISLYLLYADDTPGAIGVGTVQNGRVTINLLAYPDYQQPWPASGTMKVIFIIQSANTTGYETFSRNTLYNFTSNPTPTLPLSDFTKEVFSITLDELVVQLINKDFQAAFGNNPTTLNNFFSVVTYGDFTTYTAWRDSEGGTKLYTTTQTTTEFNGGQTVTAATTIYTPYPFWERNDSGPQLGAIKGTISLTNIPYNAEVSITVSGYESTNHYNWESSYRPRIIRGISGNSATNIPWSIPIYQEDVDDRGLVLNGNWNCTFSLEVKLDNDRGFNIRIPETKSIDFSAAGNNVFNVDPFSNSVSLRYVTLSGNITITYNNGPVPYMILNVQDGYGHAPIHLSPTVSTTRWETIFPYSTTPTDFFVLIQAYPIGHFDDELFRIQVSMGKITADANRTININVGNLADNSITVRNPPSGTYTVYVADNPYTYATDRIGRGNGNGSLIPITWYSLPEETRGYTIVIEAGSVKKYTERSIFDLHLNCIGFVDWNDMTTF